MAAQTVTGLFNWSLWLRGKSDVTGKYGTARSRASPVREFVQRRANLEGTLSNHVKGFTGGLKLRAISKNERELASEKVTNKCTALSSFCIDVAVALCMAGCFPVDISAIAATPYTQSQEESSQLGLLNGRIRACPSAMNPNCVSTSSNNAGNYAVPWQLPKSSSANAVRKIENAMLSTQANAALKSSEAVPEGHYLLMEADGLFGRDSIEFLIKDDRVFYRSMAGKIVYVYPFTTPLSDFDMQRKRMVALEGELGWAVPTCTSPDCFDSE